MRWLVLVCALGIAQSVQATAFDDADLDGCLLVQDLEGKELLRVGGDACAEPLAPCSTFKIPNALIGLQTGVLADGDATYAWDGTDQYFDSWERDHTLVSAIRDSVVWYFQRLAAEVGSERMQAHLDAFDYGNRDISGGLTTFWLSSSLKISAEQQVAFVRKLVRGELPVDAKHVAIVREAWVVEQGEGFHYSGKTGTSLLANGASHGWFVGHARSGETEVVFAAWQREPTQIWGSQVRDEVRGELAERGWSPAPTK
jgi:beta-lactamase class D